MANNQTEYSEDKNINTLNKGSYNNFGDDTPAKQILINKLNNFSPSIYTDAITVERPSETVEVFRYRQGGVGGTILDTVTVTYNACDKKDLLSVVVS